MFRLKPNQPFTDLEILKGSLTSNQLKELRKIFPTLPEYLESNNKKHLQKAWQICNYFIDLTVAPKVFYQSSISTLSYPKSTIKYCLYFILDDLRNNNLKNFHLYNMSSIQAMDSGIQQMIAIIDSSFVDIESFIVNAHPQLRSNTDNFLQILYSTIENKKK